MDDTLWRALDAAVQEAGDQGHYTGAVLLVGRGREVLYHRAYGVADVRSGEAMTVNHVFDLASLTKPLVTAVSILILAQEGKLALDDAISNSIELSWPNPPTVRQLLTHHGGLPPVVEVGDLFHTPPSSCPGDTFVYSDAGFMLLQQVVEKVSGYSLDRFYELRITEPMRLEGLGFCPTEGPFVPTFGVDKGTVHDPRARELKGVAGHAGLFGTALAVHRQLSRLSSILKPEYYAALYTPAQGGRTLGLDQDTSFSSARGSYFSSLTSAGHTGFTGTSFWWDEPSGLHVVFFASRLHPDNRGEVKEIRHRLASLVGEHFLRD